MKVSIDQHLKMSRWGKPAALILLISGILLPEIVGLARDDYNSISNYLSELGAIGVPYTYLINFAGFLPVGLVIVFLVFILFYKFPGNRWVKVGLICLLGVSVGYLGAVLFWCDYGCPSGPGITFRQDMHNRSASTEYLGAIVGLVCIFIGIRKSNDRVFSAITLVAAILVVVGVNLLTAPSFQEMRGASQRLADYSIFIWFFLAMFKHKEILNKSNNDNV